MGREASSLGHSQEPGRREEEEEEEEGGSCSCRLKAGEGN